MHLSRFRPRAWAAAVFVAVAGLAGTTLIPSTGAAAAFNAAVEDEGADCPVGSTPATNNSQLPDPFTRLDGTRISTKADWRCRRAEIRELAERTVYGQKPEKPSSVTGTVTSSRITVNVSHNGRSSSFSAGVQLPSGSGPHPAVIVLGGFGADTAAITSAGAAVISYDPLAVGQEGTSRSNKQGAFYSIYGSNSSTGLLMAWSWGVSRIIDVIESSGGNILKADATGVTGCSRYGKGAFVAGAFDQRIALTMPIESGTAGAPILRGVAQESGAQPLSSAYGEQPWLGDAFNSYTGNPAGLPVDTHQIVGMIAPRGLFIMENPHVDWLGARSGSVAALGGAEVYKALGAQANISYWSDVSDGTHCASRSEWRSPLQQSIRAFLLDSGSPPAVFRISSSKAGNLSQWRNWTTPTLPDGGTTGTSTTGTNTTGNTTTGTTGNTTTGTTGTTTTGTTGDTTTGTTGNTTTGTTGNTTDGPGDTCTATYRTVNSWQGGFQGEVTVSNNGGSAMSGWTVSMTLASGQSINNLWSGQNTGTSGSITVRNAPWNGNVPASGSVTFGFVAGGNSSPAPAITGCTS
ncbi:cellulose binding domain-containing protein [Streptomyces aidingensis]|uniref:Cellulose binding domain-containing protein n=1 Tax=Streptomyces aidingensis TaxID=910347 RepID=A0A1I1VF43_9ACTN|nr:cellulose binding domain-containing protein [Streptomyces aidingensis]SFD79060.1 Cellulose binding domain-containing protein [Streptomyces aidingensis]